MSALTYDDLKLPNYINCRTFFANLTASDAMIASVLAGLSSLLVGDTGCGKTQYASDIQHHYFGGSVADGGKGILIRANPEIDIYNEIFTQINVGAGCRELTSNIRALLYRVEELNRAPVVAQNQFFGLGDGDMDHKGKAISLGCEGYHPCMATANLGNGEFSGTFSTDKAMYNRLHVAFDFDNPNFKPTDEDRFEIEMRKADPNVKKAPPRDISDKILAAHKEISKETEDKGLEATTVLHYLGFGLENCQLVKRKGKSWPLKCQGCTYNPNDDALCSLIKEPAPRTLQATALYAAALAFLAKLKDPKITLDPVELMFKSFEMTGAYQFLLNPGVLKQKYEDENLVMMQAVVEKLKEDFKGNVKFILAAMEQAGIGKKVVNFFEVEGQIGNYDKLNAGARSKVSKKEPFNNTRAIGLEWVTKLLDYKLRKQ